MAARKKWIWLCVAAVLLALGVWAAWGNTALQCNTYTVSSAKLPERFAGFQIAQVSDLHNNQLGENNEKLLDMLRKAQPDIIAITGDLIDSRRTDIDVALAFVRQAMQIAPCYYVPGNHEWRDSHYDRLKEGLVEAGVVLLEDAWMTLSREEEQIVLLGIRDPKFKTGYLSTLTWEQEAFTVVLSHRPELFDQYVEKGFDLVLTGHAHGGQFRLPFVGGLFAPNQGLFPEYDAGLYREGDTHMLVSRGVGNSAFPLRFNNRPEILLIELQTS